MPTSAQSLQAIANKLVFEEHKRNCIELYFQLEKILGVPRRVIFTHSEGINRGTYHKIKLYPQIELNTLNYLAVL